MQVTVTSQGKCNFLIPYLEQSVIYVFYVQLFLQFCFKIVIKFVMAK